MTTRYAPSLAFYDAADARGVGCCEARYDALLRCIAIACAEASGRHGVAMALDALAELDADESHREEAEQ